MNAAVLVSVGILGGIGLVFGILIAVANRKLWVWEDPRLDVVTEMLPGTNCGACGEPGCRAFAVALLAGRVQPAACTVMGGEDVEAVADYLGVAVGEANKRVARLLCAGGFDVAIQQAEYRGLPSCAAAAAVAGGGKGCAWGCLGLGDCVEACTFDAMYMNEVGLPVVVPEACTACNDCVVACPRDLLELMPLDYRLIVQCRSLMEGDRVEALCGVACNACGRCALDAPELIRMENGLAVIDYDRNHLADPIATARCPTNAIVWVEGRQFALSTSAPGPDGQTPSVPTRPHAALSDVTWNDSNASRQPPAAILTASERK